MNFNDYLGGLVLVILALLFINFLICGALVIISQVKADKHAARVAKQAAKLSETLNTRGLK